MHEAGEFERLIGGNRIAVHDVQRITGLPHVQSRQRPPRAADRVESAILAALEHRKADQALLDEFFGLLQRLRRDVRQRQAAERPRQTVTRAGAPHVDEFERAAAEIADHAVAAMDAGNDAERGEFGFARAGQHLDFNAEDTLGLIDEGLAVLGVATGRRGDTEISFTPTRSHKAR